jgi:hypothetical protein
MSSKLMLCDNPWVGEPSRQRRRHWEVLRCLVLERVHSQVLMILCRLRRVRRACSWLPNREMVLAAARSDTLAFLHLLVECSIHTDMLLWASQQAADGDCEVPSENYHGEVSTRNMALRIRNREVERGFMRAVREAKEVSELAEEAWAEASLNWKEFHECTEALAANTV